MRSACGACWFRPGRTEVAPFVSNLGRLRADPQGPINFNLRKRKRPHRFPSLAVLPKTPVPPCGRAFASGPTFFSTSLERVASFPVGTCRIRPARWPHNRERVHIPVEHGENHPRDALFSVDNFEACFRRQGPTLFGPLRGAVEPYANPNLTNPVIAFA